MTQPTAPETPERVPPLRRSSPLTVVAAHRTGQPLNPQLVRLGGRYLAVTATAPVYRLLALAGGDVARGGIWWAGAKGASIEVEVHELPLAAVGGLLSLLPAPLAMDAWSSPTAHRSADSSAPTGPTMRSTRPPRQLAALPGVPRVIMDMGVIQPG